LIEIDGSYGEGGGQILRNAVALSVLNKKPVRINRIRANRPNPGIKAQHYISIKSISDLCNAKVDGLELGSQRLIFEPNEIKGGKFSFDIGTAGSVTLVLQAFILASINSEEKIEIHLNGGTDVKWSPSWDYFQHVFLSLLKKFGLNLKAELIKRGYYPKGGGEVKLEIKPMKKILPLSLNIVEKYSQVNGIINISNLPERIATRIKHSAIKTLLKNNVFSRLEVEKNISLSTGVGITLWSQTEDTVIGKSILGERGVSSEMVGQSAAEKIISEINANATLDTHAFDQILPYMVLAKSAGKSNCFVKEVSNHASTNMWLLKHFFDVEFDAVQTDSNIRISVI
jgi:RNA 3'-phosphate cyclase